MEYLEDWLSNKCTINDINKYFFGIRDKRNKVNVKLMEKCYGHIVYKNGCIINDKMISQCSNRLKIPSIYLINRILNEIGLFYINYKKENRIGITLILKTIENNSAEGYFNLALIYCNINSYKFAIELLEKASNFPPTIKLMENNNDGKDQFIKNYRVLEAQYHCGHLYFKINNDKEKCLYYYKMSADNNNARAAYLVGCMAIKGVGCEKNEELSKQYIVKACQIIKDNKIKYKYI